MSSKRSRRSEADLVVEMARVQYTRPSRNKIRSHRNIKAMLFTSDSVSFIARCCFSIIDNKCDVTVTLLFETPFFLRAPEGGSTNEEAKTGNEAEDEEEEEEETTEAFAEEGKRSLMSVVESE